MDFDERRILLPSQPQRHGQSVSVNTTGKQIHRTHFDLVPSWKQSQAVRAFREAIHTKHLLHYKIYAAIFSITVLLTAACIPWYQDFQDIESNTTRTTASSVVQGIHQLSVMITTFIALAIPLTANFYTPRLVDIFLKDWVNICFLTSFAVMSAVSVFMNSYLWGADTAPVIPYALMVTCGVLGWVAIIPYYYYVMRFLDPEVIVDKCARMLVREIENTVNGRHPPHICRRKLNQWDIGFRSVDRKDSRTAISCIQALCFTLDIFKEQKRKINAHFFQVELSEFPMLSKTGLSYLSNSSLWVEEQILRQIAKCFSAAVGPAGMPNIVSFVALSIREQCIPLMSDDHLDRANLILYIRFFNSFLREAANLRNVRALYNIFYQYSSLAKDLSKWCPELLVQVVKFIAEYGRLCSDKGLCAAARVNYYDLGNLCGYVHRVNSPHADAILDIVLRKQYSRTIPPQELLGYVRSRLILCSFLMYLSHLLSRDYSVAIRRIKESLLLVPEQDIIESVHDIVDTVEEMFWEITDRIVNFDYIPPQQRPYLLELQQQLLDSKNQVKL